MIFGIDFSAIVKSPSFGPAVRIIVLIFIGLPVVKLLAALAGRMTRRSLWKS